MGESLLSVGLDVGTTTTQMVVSRLEIGNRAGSFTVPEFVISQRQVIYKSPVYFTPLIGEELVDGEKIKALVAREYERAGISREQVDTGAVIITGETSRRENAEAVTRALSEYAGDFVVATAGPDLESMLAARGAGAVEYSRQTGKRVLHIDIGGGTSNIAWIEDGVITATGCVNVGGRLLRWDERGCICYISPVAQRLCDASLGQPFDGRILAKTLVKALEMAAGLRPADALLEQVRTKGTSMKIPEGEWVISFSGGVADCIENCMEKDAFGDLGPALGQEIKNSLLCRGRYRLGQQTIRATVIGAGCYSAQLSGSTVFFRNIEFPLKNLPVVPATAEDISQRLSAVDGDGILFFSGAEPSYKQVKSLAERIVKAAEGKRIYVAVDKDMAKALGQTIALMAGEDAAVLCIDGVGLKTGDYLDVTAPVGTALPVIVKTLIFETGG